jgi:hypothetical protein
MGAMSCMGGVLTPAPFNEACFHSAAFGHFDLLRGALKHFTQRRLWRAEDDNTLVANGYFSCEHLLLPLLKCPAIAGFLSSITLVLFGV